MRFTCTEVLLLCATGTFNKEQRPAVAQVQDELISVYVFHRGVEQVSVHGPLKAFGELYRVPREVGRMIHVRLGTRKKRDLKVDKRLWKFSEKLIPCVDKHLEEAGLLKSESET